MEYFAAKSEGLVWWSYQRKMRYQPLTCHRGGLYRRQGNDGDLGGGFCLMVEGIGLAGMTETPIRNHRRTASRPCHRVANPHGTGRSGFVLHSSHGEFPRAVFAPATAEDCFWLTMNAFNLAETYQLPVLIITDHYLANSYFTTEKFELENAFIARGIMFDKNGMNGEYKRYSFTASGFRPELIRVTKTRWWWLILTSMMKPDTLIGMRKPERK